MTTLDELLQLMDSNLAEVNREHARMLAPSRLVEQDDVLYAASGTRFPGGPFNSVIGLGARSPDPARTLDEARRFYDALDRGFTVFVRAHLDRDLGETCERAGLVKMSDQPGMALRQRLPVVAAPPSLEIREGRDAGTVEAFVAVSAAAYESIGMPAPVTRKAFSTRERWAAPHLRLVVAFDHGEPTSAAMLHLSHGIAGIYWVGTTPAARGRGHASAVMRHVSNLAFDIGAAAVVLQATPFGEPVYRKLGYEEVTRYPWYLAARS